MDAVLVYMPLSNSEIMGYWIKRKRAFAYALKGVARLFTDEAHAKIHLMAAVCVTACGFFFGIEKWEWCAVLICIGGVFMAEAFNTAVEKLADRVTTDRDPLIGAAKDIAAGAVLLFVVAAVIVGVIVFMPHFF